MLFEIESTGKTIEKAIENALFELKAIREDVDIKILEQGGLFKKAKVLVSISEDARDKYLKKEERKEELEAEETVKEVIEEEPVYAEEVEVVVAENFQDKEEILKDEKQPSKNVSIEKIISGKEFIEGFVAVSKCGESVEEISRDENEIKLEIKGEGASNLIGYRGECLNALQYIANVIENEEKDTKTRVVLNIENYREKREETLKALARRMAAKVQKTNKSVKLEPMCANDRRIIHTEIQNYEGLTTMSKGVEPNRFLIIMPEGEKKED